MSERQYTVEFTKSEQVSIDFFTSNMRFNKAFRPVNPGSPEAAQELKELTKRYLQYRKSWRGVPEEAIARGLHANFYKEMKAPPMSIDIETAAYCDLACPHCFREYIVTPDKHIPEALALKIIDQAAELGVPSVKFNWRGEPMTHPNLPKLVAYAKEKGILETAINTNAVTLDEKKARALIEAGLDMMIYSFDGGTAATYEKIRVGRFHKNKFENTYANIRRFSEIRKELGSPFPRTRIQMVLTPDAMGEQEEFRRRFDPIVDDVLVKAYEERGWGVADFGEEEQKDLTQRLSQKTGEHIDHVTQTMVWKKPDGSFYHAAGRLACQQIYQRLMVAYDGGVYMCCNDWANEHPIGYVSENGWKDGMKDYTSVQKRIGTGTKGFELMKGAKMPQRYNTPKQAVSTLSDIWDSTELNKVRKSHIEGNLNSIPACEKCTFRDTFKWEKL